VRDSGIGLPHDRLADIFEPFVQLERGANGSQGGLGVGLTLVKTLVELHGGNVSASSAGPGRGSEFVVSLPGAREAEAPEPAAEPPPTRRRAAARARGAA
jgi:signal transduction histidine kinase